MTKKLPFDSDKEFNLTWSEFITKAKKDVTDEKTLKSLKNLEKDIAVKAIAHIFYVQGQISQSEKDLKRYKKFMLISFGLYTLLLIINLLLPKLLT